jgi:hypothetical protein
LDENSTKCRGEQRLINCSQMLSWVNQSTSEWIILSLAYIDFTENAQAQIDWSHYKLKVKSFDKLLTSTKIDFIIILHKEIQVNHNLKYFFAYWPFRNFSLLW